MSYTSSRTLVRIGLTGGIGAGKSTVAAIWRQAGTCVIDLDALSRAVLDVPGDGVEEAIVRFGERLRNAAGTVDRAALARIVFSDVGAREDLERIVLRRVEEGTARAEARARADGERLVVHDNPLLFEKNRDRGDEYALVVAVMARREDRIARVGRDRGKDRTYVESVMSAQVTDLARIRRADRLILNTGDEAGLRARALRELDHLHTRYVRPAS
jgi:dephospho-CoA kinase